MIVTHGGFSWQLKLGKQLACWFAPKRVGEDPAAEVRFHVRHLADSCERDGDGEMRDA